MILSFTYLKIDYVKILIHVCQKNRISKIRRKVE